MNNQTLGSADTAVKLTHVAKRDRRCYRCGSTIPAGARYLLRSERALSYREAAHAGSMTVRRHVCAECSGGAK